MRISGGFLGLGENPAVRTHLLIDHELQEAAALLEEQEPQEQQQQQQWMPHGSNTHHLTHTSTHTSALETC